MTRQHFLQLMALAIGGALMPLNATTSSKKRAPAFFVGHGSPMIGIEENDFTHALNSLRKKLGEPKAILMISAHWTPALNAVSVHHSSALMYDFFGFPDELYKVQYPAPNAEFLTPKIQKLINGLQIKERALDHGSWTVLKHLFPLANIPVMQLGINQNLTLQEHFELAHCIRVLRDHGVMIIGSGNLTHNLSIVERSEDAAPQTWAVEFDTFIKEAIEKKDFDALIGFQKIAPNAVMAHPTLEHYIPLLYVAGAMYDEDESIFPYQGFSHGTLSMRSWLLDSPQREV